MASMYMTVPEEIIRKAVDEIKAELGQLLEVQQAEIKLLTAALAAEKARADKPDKDRNFLIWDYWVNELIPNFLKGEDIARCGVPEPDYIEGNIENYFLRLGWMFGNLARERDAAQADAAAMRDKYIEADAKLVSWAAYSAGEDDAWFNLDDSRRQFYIDNSAQAINEKFPHPGQALLARQAKDVKAKDAEITMLRKNLGDVSAAGVKCVAERDQAIADAAAMRDDARRYRYLIDYESSHYDEDKSSEPSPGESFLTIDWQGGDHEWHGWDALIDERIRKAEVCEYCLGSGQASDDEDIPLNDCDECHGTGRIPYDPHGPHPGQDLLASHAEEVNVLKDEIEQCKKEALKSGAMVDHPDLGVMSTHEAYQYEYNSRIMLEQRLESINKKHGLNIAVLASIRRALSIGDCEMLSELPCVIEYREQERKKLLSDAQTKDARISELENHLLGAVELIEHLAQYWNHNQNTGAMTDACWHTVEMCEEFMRKDGAKS